MVLLPVAAVLLELKGFVSCERYTHRAHRAECGAELG